HFRLSRRIDIAAQTELRSEVKGDGSPTPIVVTVRKKRAQTGVRGLDGQLIEHAAFSDRAEPVWISDLTFPTVFRLGCRTVENVPVRAHLRKNPIWPAVIKLRHFDATGI